MENARGDRGWIVRWDIEDKTWIAENRGLGEHGLPAKGEPGSYGYDANGDLLPYANHRPPYAEGQVEEVWLESRETMIYRMEHGDLRDLPKFENDRQMWVQTLSDRKGPNIFQRNDGSRWRLIEWSPGEPRQGRWQMGHIYGEEYRTLRERYLNHEIDSRQFIERFHDADNYIVQDSVRNSSHVDEMALPEEGYVRRPRRQEGV